MLTVVLVTVGLVGAAAPSAGATSSGDGGTGTALAAGSPGHWWDTWRSFLTDVGAFLGWAIGAILVLALAVVVAAALVNQLVLEPLRRRPARRGPAPSAGRLRRGWRDLTQPRLNVVAGDGDTSKMFAIRVRETVRRLNDGPGGGQLRFASVPEETLDLAELGDVDARLKPIVAALTYAVRRDTVTVTLSTGSDDDTHPRIGAEAVARKAEGRTATFSRAVAAKTDAPALVGVTAGWALFSAEQMRPRLRDGGDLVATYGTSDQRSYSAFVGGDAARRAGDLETARSLLATAVGHDGGFDRAKLDLGAVELVSPDPVTRDIGLQRLLALHRLTMGVAGS